MRDNSAITALWTNIRALYTKLKRHDANDAHDFYPCTTLILRHFDLEKNKHKASHLKQKQFIKVLS